MRTLLLDARDVRDLLTPGRCIEALEAAFRALGSGSAVQPMRVAAWRPDARGAMAAMPAFIGDPPVLGAKLIAVFPQNRPQGLPSHQGIVALHDPEEGRLIALIDAGAITVLRTAGASALATGLLAREDAGVLALLGSGEQAKAHLRAIGEVRRLREVRVWSRTPEHAHAFSAEAAGEGPPVYVAGTTEEAVRDADVVCTLTAATRPILEGRHLAPGAHVNAVGASTPAFRELDAEVVARCRLFADSRVSLLRESADYGEAVREGAIGEGHLAGELADLVLGRVQGRESPQQLTLFKSLGLAIEDLAAAHAVYVAARAQGRGTEFSLS